LQIITRLDLTDYTREELRLLHLVGNQDRKIAAGTSHSFFVTSQGQVYVCGEDNLGETGLMMPAQGQILVPTLINRPEMGQIVSMATNSGHSLFLNSQGQVFSCGDGSALGLGEITRINIPRLIDSSEMGIIVVIAAGGGYGFSLFLNTRGQVYVCGYGEDGELGISDARRSWGQDRLGLGEEQADIPTLLECLAMGKIVAISAGENHSLLLNSQGQVWGFGQNILGELGLGEGNDKQETPALVNTKEMGMIMAISTGIAPSLFLNTRGQLFTCGFNGNGQLGNGTTKNVFTPELIKDSSMGQIIAISAGGNHSLVLDHQGQVYGFGSNGCNQLGPGKKRYLRPTFLKMPGPMVVISAGCNHSLVLNHQGQIFGFGSNEESQLGLKGYSTAVSPSDLESQKKVSRPTLVWDLAL
jgi:alpha-tubulin suppressor-like RCC1 family protein